MPDNFNLMMTSPEQRYGYQLNHSIRMIADITREYDGAVDTGRSLSANAMLDAFYLHIRLLADFLVKKTNGRDFGPADFGVEWDIPTTPEAKTSRSTGTWRPLSSCTSDNHVYPDTSKTSGFSSWDCCVPSHGC